MMAGGIENRNTRNDTNLFYAFYAISQLETIDSSQTTFPRRQPAVDPTSTWVLIGGLLHDAKVRLAVAWSCSFARKCWRRILE